MTRPAWPAFLTCLIATPVWLSAQTSPGPSSAEKSPAEPEPAVVLSPFEVLAGDDDGYVATGTLAGTRFNTSLKDVAASLSVMTSEFLRDIGALNLNDALEYTISAEQDYEDVTGNPRQGSDLQLRMRGFRNSVLGRNFFESQTAQDNYNMERATFSRGPNSVIFGTGGAGGIADATTKRAQQKSLTSLTARVGSYDDYRLELDVNRPVTKKLAIRLNALVWSKRTWRDLEHLDRKSAALAITWKPFERTTVRLDSEFGQVDELRAQPWPAFDSVTNWIAAGRPISATFGAAVTGTSAITATQNIFISNSNELLALRNSRQTTPARSGVLGQNNTTFENESVAPFSSNVMGPGATQNNDFRTTGVFVEQRVLKNLFVEAAANQQHVERDWNRALVFNDVRLIADPNALRPDGTPNRYVGQYYVEQTNPQRANVDFRNQTWNDYRFTASYQFDLGRAGNHQLAGLVARRDFFNRGHVKTEAWINNPANRDYTNAANQIIRRTYVSFGPDNPLRLPSTFQDPYTTPIDVNGVQSGYFYSNKLAQLSNFNSKVAVLQSRFFGEHVVTTFGARADQQRSWGSTVTRDTVTREVLYATRNAASTLVKGNTVTAGIVLHATSWLSLAANKSSNASPQNFIAFGPDSANLNTPLGNRNGEGRDFAARFTLFDGRAHGSVTYYETDEQNSQRFKLGNATSGWELWINQAYISLGKPGASVTPNYITGEDTVDITSDGWETEWVFNVTKSLRFVANASKTDVKGSNQWPRITAIARPLLVEMKANPTLPVAGITNNTTLGALATTMENQMAVGQQTSGKPVLNSRPYGGNFFVNYRFSEGRLAGLGLTLGANARGHRVIGYNTVTLQPVWDGDYTQFNGSITYRRQIRSHGRKIEWSAALAGTNILGRREGLLPIIGDEIGIDRFSFEVTPTFSLTNRFSF